MDVWCFVTPSEVAAALPDLGRRLGRRRRFWEFLINGWRNDGLPQRIVDLVLERVPQTCGAKHLAGSIAIDPLEEILINKVTTILSRAEERDLVDLLFIERHGLKIRSALRPALEKDGGCTPAALAWVLAEVSIPDGIELPGGVSPAELRTFVADLVVRLRHAAFPAPESR